MSEPSELPPPQPAALPEQVSTVGGRLAIFITTGLGVGFFPVAPGTVGALWGIPLSWAMAPIPWWWQLAMLAIMFAVSVPLCTLAARELNRKDPGCVVLDEIVSMPLVFLGVRLEGPDWRTISLLVVGFGLHRFFDITKLPPTRRLESLPQGLGIMADDIMAGIYAGLVLWLISLAPV